MIRRLSTVAAACALALAPAAEAGRARGFDAAAAWKLLRMQVALGPRPAGSARSRQLAALLRARLPRGTFEAVPGGLRNVVGLVPGSQPQRVVVVGAHYDTKDLPGFVGADDGASGVAVVTQLARTIAPHELRPTVVFVLFDGEETPRGTPDTETDFLASGVRGSRIAAAQYRDAEAMILLDMVGDGDLSIPRESSSDPKLWAKLRAAAARVGTPGVFSGTTNATVFDDHTPFEQQGVPSIDLIDFTYACWHRPCDDLRHVSQRSLKIVGATVLELLRRL